jgi:von Willebrand factor type A domain
MRNTLISFMVCLSACGAALDQPQAGSRCLSLSEPGANGLTTSLPSRISWLFRVETCTGQPVAGLTATQFEIYEDGKKVSAYESQQQVAARGERYRLYSIVLLDLSGSILRSGDFAQVQTAAATYLETALHAGGDGHRIALMSFDGREQPQLLVSFTSNLATLRAGLDALAVSECSSSADCATTQDRRTCAGWRCVDDSTNLNGAVVKTLGVLDTELNTSDVPWRDGALVLFTDGTDQAARMTAATALDAVKKSAQHVFSIGLGGEVDEGALRGFGKDGYWPVAKAAELKPAFTEIAARVSGLANRFYALEYCSPKRNGTHALKVVATVETERDGTMTGSLTGQFDATGFTSGCQL